MHLVAFIIRMFHDARSPERQTVCLSYRPVTARYLKCAQVFMQNMHHLFDFKQNRNIWKMLLEIPNIKLQENLSPEFSLLHD